MFTSLIATGILFWGGVLWVAISPSAPSNPWPVITAAASEAVALTYQWWVATPPRGQEWIAGSGVAMLFTYYLNRARIQYKRERLRQLRQASAPTSPCLVRVSASLRLADPTYEVSPGLEDVVLDITIKNAGPENASAAELLVGVFIGRRRLPEFSFRVPVGNVPVGTITQSTTVEVESYLRKFIHRAYAVAALRFVAPNGGHWESVGGESWRSPFASVGRNFPEWSNPWARDPFVCRSPLGRLARFDARWLPARPGRRDHQASEIGSLDHGY